MPRPHKENHEAAVQAMPSGAPDSRWDRRHAMKLSIFSVFFFSSRRRHTRCLSDWSSDVCSSDLAAWRYCTLHSSDRGDSVLNPYKPYLLERWNAGCYTAMRLFRDLRQRGYRGGYEIGRASCRERVESAGGAGSCR